MKTCKKCGSKNFWITESLLWKCYLTDDGTLGCHNPNNEIETMSCKECGATYSEGDFKEINFN